MVTPQGFTDYYRVLKVDRTASQNAIKQAYRRLARQLHPDLNPHDDTAEARFKALNEAYVVLSDDVKRRHYDRYGQNWNHHSPRRAAPGGRPADDFEQTEFGRHDSFSAFIQDMMNRYG